jgi:hypothetical protein
MKTSVLLVAASLAAPALADEPRPVFPAEIISPEPPAPVGGKLHETRESRSRSRDRFRLRMMPQRLDGDPLRPLIEQR